MNRDKVALGRKGEIFVMGKLMENGWKMPTNINFNMEGNDWAFEKDGRIIKIQVKTSENAETFSHKGKKEFNYLIFNNLRDIWVIPIEMLKVTDKLNKTFKKLKNKFILLEKQKEGLLLEINDCGVKFGEFNTISPFLVKNNQ